MMLGRGVVGVTDEGIVFVEKPVSEKKARRVALRVVGSFVNVVPVGRIVVLQFAESPVYPVGCSPNYGAGRRYETCRHCVSEGLCGIRTQVDMSDGSRASVVDIFRYNACESWICWVFARFLNKYGFVYDRCIEYYDNATLDRGNEGRMPDLVLFAGSEDKKLALFVRGIYSKALPRPPFKVKVQSADYWVKGDRPKIVNWETTIDGVGLFLVWFNNYVLPYRAYYSYLPSVEVKPGFSGSNAFLV
jgi:hypothetical protein